MLTSEQKKTCIEKIIALTVVAPIPGDDRPRNTRNVQEALNQHDFGQYQPGIEALMTALTGYPMKRTASALKPQKFQALVPLNNTSSGHSFPIGKPMIVTGITTDYCSGIRPDGAGGGNGYPKEFRPATKEEINQLTDAQLEVAFKDAVFL